MGKPTINDVARLAGVSKKTVSRVINRSPLLSEGTRERVKGVIAEIGFAPNPQARALALRRNFLVALVHDASVAPVIAEVAAELGAGLRGSGLALLLHSIGIDGVAELRGLLEGHRPAGTIVLAPTIDSAALCSLCTELETPCVLVQPADDRAAMARLVRWLAASGHRRIALVAGPEGSRSARERRRGYLDAVADEGLDHTTDLMAQGDGSFASGTAAGQRLLALSPRPTAIAAVNDEMAVGVIHAALRAGVDVPTMLSVTGFDDAPLAARLWPPLTTVRVPWAAMTRAAAAPLVGSAAPAPIELELMVRGSAARLA